MNYKEQQELIERLSKEVKEEFEASFEYDDFSSHINMDSEFPELLSEIDATMDNLKLQIRVLKKAYEAIGKHPLYHVNSDFESLDGMFDGVYEEILKLIGDGIEVKKTYHSGDEEE